MEVQAAIRLKEIVIEAYLETMLLIKIIMWRKREAKKVVQ